MQFIDRKVGKLVKFTLSPITLSKPLFELVLGKNSLTRLDLNKFGLSQHGSQSASFKKNRKLRGRVAGITVLGFLAILTGCASSIKQTDVSDTSKESSTTQKLEQDMVRDVVSVLPQLLEPLGATIQFNDVHSGDVDALIPLLSDFGYGLQKVDADQGKYFLTLDNVSTASDIANQETRLRLSLGSIELTRVYKTLSNRSKVAQANELKWHGNKAMVASGPLIVVGSRLPISLKGFALAGTSNSNELFVLGTGSVEYASAIAVADDTPTVSVMTDESFQSVAQTTSSTSFSATNSATLSTNTSSSDFGDAYVKSFTAEGFTHLSNSHFASIADTYQRVNREVIIFPNDSQSLGRLGKLQLRKIYNDFTGSTDLVGVIGCSNGPTRLEAGNEGLALGRAQRIAEEFYTAGISSDKVFNEGCFSPEIGVEGYPNRGVVVDLWRKKA